MRRRVSLLLIILFLSSVRFVNAAPVDSLSVSSSELAERIINEAEKYIGKPYRAGGKGPSSFDCSGFTRFVYGKFGYELSPNSSSQAKEGREVTGAVSNLQKGDILVFGMRYNRKTIGHVGIYVGPEENGDGFRFIHASRRGIKISSSTEDYYANRLLGARRILPDFLPDAGDCPAERIDSTFVSFRDTLELGHEDYRILLLSDGTWAYVLADGTVQRPSERKEKIVLDTNGRWISLPISYHTIPSRVSYESSDKRKTQTSDSTPKVSETSSEAVYHIIKQGDTLLGIAHRYHSSVSAICSFNGITERTILKIGRKLRVK